MKKADVSARCRAARAKRKKITRPAPRMKHRKAKASRAEQAVKVPPRCQICDRKPGTRKKDRFGNPDPNPQTPLGRLNKCPSCGLWACPDCLLEVDCCFREEAEHEDDPNWAPPGWKRIKDEWIRMDATSSICG